VKKKYQSQERKSNHKFEIVRGQELRVQVPLPMAEVWAEMQAQVEELTGQAGLQILRAVLENGVTHRVGPPHRPNPSAGGVRWGKQPGYVVFAGQKVPLERPRVRTRKGQEVELESYRQLQQDGKLQRAVREGVVAGLSTRNYRRAVESVVEGYGIEKSSVSRQFVAASSNQLRALCERRLEDLNLVVLMIDGIHFGGQVLVVALGIAEGGEKHVLGVWQGATENTTVVKGLLEDLVDRGLDDRQRLTQVGRALRELNIEMIPAYSPQARGRSERNFGTWQAARVAAAWPQHPGSGQ
jgi:putative transposase